MWRALLVVLSIEACTVKLPIEDFSVSGLTATHKHLIAVSRTNASVVLIRRSTWAGRIDKSLVDQKEVLVLEGAATLSDNSKLYLASNKEGAPSIVEYDWLNTLTITRRFSLISVLGSAGLHSLTWVPMDSAEGGYFYIGDRLFGAVYVVQLPVASSTTSEEVTLITKLTPLPTNRSLTGMTFANNRIWYNYLNGTHTVVASAPIGPVGNLPLSVDKEYQAGVPDSQGFLLTQERTKTATGRSHTSLRAYFASRLMSKLIIMSFNYDTGFRSIPDEFCKPDGQSFLEGKSVLYKKTLVATVVAAIAVVGLIGLAVAWQFFLRTCGPCGPITDMERNLLLEADLRHSPGRPPNEWSRLSSSDLDHSIWSSEFESYSSREEDEDSKEEEAPRAQSKPTPKLKVQKQPTPKFLSPDVAPKKNPKRGSKVAPGGKKPLQIEAPE
eukprot:Platyproteum_vivax@DN5228_c0_g1_i1.p1